MIPMVLFGSFIGIIFSSILPEAILTIFLVSILFFSTYDSFRKAIGLWKKETIALEKDITIEQSENNYNLTQNEDFKES